MQIDVVKDFAYSYHGHDCVPYEAGTTVDVPEECAELAIREGWAKPAKRKMPPKEAPETAAADGAPETK
jgi:hypothetical protein